MIVAVVLAFVFLRGDDPEPAADTETPAAATPTPTPSAVGLQPGDVVMQGPAGSKALAVLRLVPTGENRIEFALVGQDIPPNANGERYSLWFRNEDGKAQLVGDISPSPWARTGSSRRRARARTTSTTSRPGSRATRPRSSRRTSRARRSRAA